MVSSMTGYGEAKINHDGVVIKIEIRALNGKTIDARLRIPNQYRSQELKIRKILLSSLERGKIDLTATVTTENEQSTTINKPLLKAYIEELLSLQNEMGIELDGVLPAVLSIPKIMDYTEEEASKSEVEMFYKCLDMAISNINNFRNTEGQSLYNDLLDRLNRIIVEQAKVSQYISARDASISERLKTKLLSSFDSKNIDENRFEQEIIYYLDKLDLNEELVRLDQHCKYFIEILNNNDIVKGKKLSFIAQEIGREINTLGSKAQYADIQKLVVVMKDDLEKIKEQLANAM